MEMFEPESESMEGERSRDRTYKGNEEVMISDNYNLSRDNRRGLRRIMFSEFLSYQAGTTFDVVAPTKDHWMMSF